MCLKNLLLNFRQRFCDKRKDSLRAFKAQFNMFKELAHKNNRFELRNEDLFPCLNDATQNTEFDHHYIYHLAWAARILTEKPPSFHVDISSSLYFSSIVSAFIPVKFYDYRPANLKLSNLVSEASNLVKLPFHDNSIESLSCMHTVEHVGLGRYGDDLDPDGDLKAIKELKRVLSENGRLLFVVPIGKSKIMFNAHRIYSYDQIKYYFSDLRMDKFDLIPDDARNCGMIYDASKEEADIQNYGCGCFCFSKETKSTKT